MEREFGTRSYKPADFRFRTIYAGKHNKEYHNLFTRKLPGNILDCAYYTPMNVRELAVELGVSAAYLEDEIAVLEKYGLIRSLSGGKYQTNLVIFTKDFRNELIRTAEDFLTEDMGEILISVQEKLPKLRELQFIGSDMEDNRLLWSLLFEIIRKGKDSLGMVFNSEIYSGAAGTNYGTEYDSCDEHDLYGCYSFAGYCTVTEGYSATYAEFGILPQKNRFQTHLDTLKKNVTAMAEGKMESIVPIVRKSQQELIDDILRQEIKAFGQVYQKLYKTAVKIMRAHAPESVSSMVDNVMANALFFDTVGIWGYCAVKSEKMTIPEDNLPAAVLVIAE